MLRIPGFSERNLFDAVYDTIDRLDRLEGRKYIILVSSGRDTFSKLNLDQILKKIKTTKNITIYSISIGRALREYLDSHGILSVYVITAVMGVYSTRRDPERRELCRSPRGWRLNGDSNAFDYFADYLFGLLGFL